MKSSSSWGLRFLCSERFWERFALTLLIINLINLVWFISFRYDRLAFNSDSAKKVLLAKEIFETGHYFPPDWTFANQDLWIIPWHTLIIPLLYFFPVGYTVHAIVAIVASSLILIAIWLVLSEINISNLQKILVLAVFASGISLTLTENLFGQVSYGTTFLYYCIIIFTAWLVLERSGGTSALSGMFLAALLMIIAWANPLRAVIYFIAPLMCSLLYYSVQALNDRVLCSTYRKILNLLFFCFLGTLVGALLHKVTIPNVLMHEGVTQLHWVPLTEVFQKIPKIFRSLLFILGGEPHAGRSIYTVSAAYDGFRLIVAVCFIALVPLALVRVFRQHGNTATKFAAVFGCSAFGIVCFLILTTNIYNGRYLLPAMLVIIFVVLAQDVDFRVTPIFGFFRALVIVGFLTNALVVNTTYWATYHASEAHQDDYQTYDKPYELAQFLLEQNLKYGYATFWNASVITVLSDHRTVVNQIYIKDGLPYPLKWLSTRRAFYPSNYVGESFLLLHQAQADSINWPYLADKFGLIPSRKLQYKDFMIYVFPENVASKLSNWKDD